MRNTLLCVCLKAKATSAMDGGERSQQKIARFECIQLFCLWALFKYDIIHPSIHPAVPAIMKCLFSHVAPMKLRVTVPTNEGATLRADWQRSVLRNIFSSAPILNNVLGWYYKHNKKYFFALCGNIFSCSAMAWIKLCDIIALNVFFFFVHLFCILSHDHHHQHCRRNEKKQKFCWKCTHRIDFAQSRGVSRCKLEESLPLSEQFSMPLKDPIADRNGRTATAECDTGTFM